MIENFLTAALENKDVFTTIITLLVVFAWMIPLFKRLVKQVVDEMHIWFERVSESIGKSYLSDTDEILELVSKYIKSATTNKMDFLRIRLEQNSIHEDVEWVQRQIRSKLETLSMELYIRPLNKKNTKVWLLWDYTIKTYPMDIFLEDLFWYFFHKGYTEKQKLNYIQNTVMPEYLNRFIEHLRNDLNK